MSRLGCALVGLLCGLATAESVDDVLFEARHAHLVQGDLDRAIALYRKALEDTSLTAAHQAEVHFRVARCYEEQKLRERAIDHLMPHVFAHDSVDPGLRERADALRARLEAQRPKERSKPPPDKDPKKKIREQFAEELTHARRFLEGGDDMRALWHTARALDLIPDDEAALAIDAELAQRLSGVADFVRDPLRFVRKWTETRIAQVAKQAQVQLAQGVAHAEAKDLNLAWAAFREAVSLIDSCEFAQDSDRLTTLRLGIVARWSAAHRTAFGKPLDESAIPAPARRATPLGEYLNRLQHLLDLISSKEHEYRIVPVRAPRGREGKGWRSKPETHRLFRDIPSGWSPAAFARLYLPLRVRPDTWVQRGNYIDAVGGMLVARNRSNVLDALLDEIGRLEKPPTRALLGRFLLVPVSRDALARFEQEFGAFEVSHRGRDAVQYRVLAKDFGLDYLCSYLIDLGVDVNPARHTFSVDVANGAPQTLFVAKPLADARGYEGFRAAGASPWDTHYGLLIDQYPLRDSTGNTAAAMRLSARIPVPPLRADAPRFLKQEADLFVDLREGATLVVAGLVDPFAERDGEMLLIWQYPTAGTDVGHEPTEASPLGTEVPLRNLLLRQRDFPGPRADETRGFISRPRLEVLAARASFLEAFLRRELGTDDVRVRVEDAVATVPGTRRPDATQVVLSMEAESARSYIIEVHTRAVRSSVLKNWIERKGLKLTRLEGAEVALADARASILFDGLAPTETPDLFAPSGGWHKPTALGFQARHLLSARTRTSPVYDSEEDLATGETRTITEGIRITARPYTWRPGNRLFADIVVQTATIELDEEERALAQAVPSRRTRFSGSRAHGTIDFGNPDAPKTALICRIPHPTLTRPDRVTEIVIALSIRRVP